MLVIVRLISDNLSRMMLILVVYLYKVYMQRCIPLLKARMNLLLKLILPAGFSYIKKREEVYKIIHILKLVPIVIYRLIVSFWIFATQVIVFIYTKGV